MFEYAVEPITKERYRELIKPWEYDFTRSLEGVSGRNMASMFVEVYGRTHVAAINEYCFARLEGLHRYTILDIGSGPFIGLKAYIEYYCRGPADYVAVDRSQYFLEYGKQEYHQYAVQTFSSMSACCLDVSDRPVLIILSYLFQNAFFDRREFTMLLERLQKTGREIFLYIQDTNSAYFNEVSISQFLDSAGFFQKTKWNISLNPRSRNSNYKNYLRHGFFSNSKKNMLIKDGVSDEYIF